MKYLGLDYHKAYSYATLLDAQTGEYVQQKLENTPEAIRAFLGRDAGQTVAVLEAGRCWGWMYDLLCTVCHKVKVAHPYKVRAIAAARIKHDRLDSKTLSELLALNMIPEAYARGPENRRQVAVLRQRAFWVDFRTRTKNRIHDIIDRQGRAVTGEMPCCSDMFGKAGRAWLEQLELPPSERLLLDEMLGGLDYAQERVAHSDERVRALLKADPVAQRLKTIPGIGDFFSVLIRTEIDDINRFPSAARLHSYAGLVPSVYASGGTVRHGRITRQGNRWLRWAAVEASIPATTAHWPLRQKYAQLKRRTGSGQKAKVAVARLLLTYVYHVWKEERDFVAVLKKKERNEPPCSFPNGA